MSFLAPGWLWLLVAVTAVAGVYVGQQVRRSEYTVRFTTLDLLDVVAPKRPGWRRHIPAAVFLAAVVALVVALARPARDEQVPQERATVIMAIDTSLSMDATDVAPTRLQAAQTAASGFVDQLPPTINLGLVTFNGIAQITVAPTTDRTAVHRAIDGIALGESTAIGEAIFASLAAIDLAPGDDEPEPAPASVILMSDGTTTLGRSDEAGATAARASAVPVSTIAFGTTTGVITIEGEPAAVPVDEDALAAIADGTGGSFFAAASGGELEAVYTDLGSAVGTVSETREITTWFVGLGVALLLVTSGLSMLWFSRLP